MPLRANRPALDAVAKKVEREARAAARYAVANLAASDRKVAGSAIAVVIRLKDLAIVPLLDAPEASEADDRVWRIENMVDAQLELRQRIVGRLPKMLDDPTAVPIGSGGVAETAPPPRRVCDDAYVLLRRLLNTAESAEQQHASTNAFLALPDDRKDEQIRNARNGTWTRLADLR